VIDYLLETPPHNEREKLSQAIENFKSSSLFNVEYNLLKTESESFTNESIRIFGTILDEFKNEFILFTDPFEDNEYGFYRIKFDNPLPKQFDIPRPFKFIARGSKISVFSRFNGLTDIKVNELESIASQPLNPLIDYTRLRRIPTFTAVLIYDHEDFDFKRPLWISSEFVNEILEK
jgi:hypothetical protein